MFPHYPLSVAVPVLLSVLFSIVLPQITNAETARLEIYSIETLILTDQQFLLGAKDGKPARIGAELRLPAETARIPAVVLIHGSGGVGANVDGWGAGAQRDRYRSPHPGYITGRSISQTSETTLGKTHDRDSRGINSGIAREQLEALVSVDNH